MPTTNPRLAITIPPATRQVLARMSRHLKTPASRLVTELLVEATPALEHIAGSLDELQARQSALTAQFKRQLTEVEERAYRAAVDAMDILAELRAVASHEADGRGAAARHGARGPRASNNGGNATRQGRS